MIETLTLVTLSAILTIYIILTRNTVRQLRRDILTTTRGARQARVELLEDPRYKDLDA